MCLIPAVFPAPVLRLSWVIRSPIKHDGQNVLFLDGRVTFETRSYCGVERDNIYTLSTNTTGSHVYGAMPVSASVMPTNRNDSLLVHDPQSMPDSGPKRRRP